MMIAFPDNNSKKGQIMNNVSVESLLQMRQAEKDAMAAKYGKRPRPNLSIEQVCEAVGCSRAFLYLLWGRNKGPRAIKIGRRVFVRRDDFDMWMASLEEYNPAAEPTELQA